MGIVPTSFLKLERDRINGLARSYRTLAAPSDLRSMLSVLFPDSAFNDLNKRALHEVISDILLMNHAGEEVLKYHLIKEFFNKKVVAAFEMRVNKSRIDFLTINGQTRSYEIKSNLDSLQKLPKQMDDYMKVFEYNYLVIDEKHLPGALRMAADNYGIWVFKDGKKNLLRDATLNEDLEPAKQIGLFTKRELGQHFGDYTDKRDAIVSDFPSSEINDRFKEMLKGRFDQRWNFILKNRREILPIDFHFFFHNNISPELVYRTR
jgi:hypothetical protein